MIYILITIIIFFIDQRIKKKIDYEMSLSNEKWIFNETILLNKSYNKGAILGILNKKPRFLLISNIIVIIIFSIYYIKEIIYGDSLIKFILSLMVGGAFSNVYDRIKYGYVIDYFSFKKLKKIIFNLADIFMIIGIFLFLIYNIFITK